MKIRPLFDRSVTGETANAGTVLSLGLDQAGLVPDFIILVSCFLLTSVFNDGDL